MKKLLTIISLIFLFFLVNHYNGYSKIKLIRDNIKESSLNRSIRNPKSNTQAITIDAFLSKLSFSLRNPNTEILINKNSIKIVGEVPLNGYYDFTLHLKIEGSTTFLPVVYPKNITIPIVDGVPIITHSEILNLGLNHGNCKKRLTTFGKSITNLLWFYNGTYSDVVVYVLEIHNKERDILSVFSIDVGNKPSLLRSDAGVLTFLVYLKEKNSYIITNVVAADCGTQKFSISEKGVYGVK